MKRTIKQKVTGSPAVDGAGVHLVRVLGHGTIDAYDPILMLDSFDSTDPSQYTAGFPMHPHRGIETISLIVKGKMMHRDSLGNQDTISDGEVQWMTAGSGILHEEKLPASERMLGVQLWLNMPKKSKMDPPGYHSLKKNEIPEVPVEGGTLRIISGSYNGLEGFQGKHLPLDYYHIKLEAGSSITLDTETDKSVMVFLLSGDAGVAGERVKEKTAVKLSEGESLELEALEEPIDILFLSTDRLGEPVSWGGPIVMNTREELDLAFRELRNGTFIKEQMKYE